uniref:Uncharacterized protein n=1 Tax=Parascaris equorum TaxID=6256 RepID=A0A914RPQ8_PAREQ
MLTKFVCNELYRASCSVSAVKIRICDRFIASLTIIHLSTSDLVLMSSLSMLEIRSFLNDKSSAVPVSINRQEGE